MNIKNKTIKMYTFICLFLPLDTEWREKSKSFRPWKQSKIKAWTIPFADRREPIVPPTVQAMSNRFITDLIDEKKKVQSPFNSTFKRIL